MTNELVGSAFWTAVVGGLVGGFLGVLATLLSSYYGPRKLEEWRDKRLEEKINGPRKRLLKKLLDDTRFADGRKIDTLSRVSGTTLEECRRLLVELNARGVLFADGSEGWVLISRKPLEEL
jgi:hypothetical protein